VYTDNFSCLILISIAVIIHIFYANTPNKMGTYFLIIYQNSCFFIIVNNTRKMNMKLNFL
jgi:hypothetical protein